MPYFAAEYFWRTVEEASATPPPHGECAYGNIVPQSFGMQLKELTWWSNLCVYPNCILYKQVVAEDAEDSQNQGKSKNQIDVPENQLDVPENQADVQKW